MAANEMQAARGGLVSRVGLIDPGPIPQGRSYRRGVDLVVGAGCAAFGAVAGILAGSVARGGPGPLRACTRWVAAGTQRDGAALGIVSGVLAGLVGARLGVSLALPAFWAPAALAGPLAVADLLRNRLPYALMVPLYVIGGPALAAAAVSLGNVGSLARAVGAAMAATVLFLAMALGRPGQLGLGDVVLVGALTLSLGWLGWRQVIAGLMVGLLVGAVTGLVLATVRGSPKRVVLPLGPALLAGWLVVVLW